MLPQKSLAFFVLLTVLLSCRENRKLHTHAFYYWKTTFPAKDTSGKTEIKNLAIQHLYLRFLDVDWSGSLNMPVPVGEAKFYDLRPMEFFSVPVTPVIFITNRTFEEMPAEWCDTLAQKITRKLDAAIRCIRESEARCDVKDSTHEYSYEAGHRYDSLLQVARSKHELEKFEVQIDCDWTEATKDKYFEFLSTLKSFNPELTFSATIRLYPYKYRQKMGIPPVDRGMLMCYNLGKINLETTKNSIFDINELKQYLTAEKYPLPLDVALPVFSWYVWFRDGKYKGIIHHQELAITTDFCTKENAQTYRITKDTVLAGAYFREGDELRFEIPDDDALIQAAALLDEKLPQFGDLTFFDWDETSMQQHEKAIQTIFDRH